MNVQKIVLLRVIGFVGSIILTFIAFFIVVHPESFHLQNRLAIGAILFLGALQFLVQFLFFINIWQESGPRWNLAVLISTILIVLTIVFFSIWIMNDLNYHMIMK